MATKRLYRSKNGEILGVCRGIAEWRDYPAASLAPGVAVTALPAPFFPVFSLALSIDVKRGNTVVLGGALLAEPGKGERFQLFFVNADVVDLDGVSIPAP